MADVLAPSAPAASTRLLRTRLTIPTAGRPIVCRGRPVVMGIVNVTPDSFSDGGLFFDAGRAAAHAQRLVAEGAEVLDVGGASTRPGAAAVPLTEELRRVVPVIRTLAKRVRVPISVDTSKAEVAMRALDAGAAIINDVTALRGDTGMAAVAARSRAAVILMHMRGSPRTMQRRPRYHDVVADVAAAELVCNQRESAELSPAALGEAQALGHGELVAVQRPGQDGAEFPGDPVQSVYQVRHSSSSCLT